MKHARLSPSASARWLQCPGSIKLTEDLKLVSESSYAAEEGSAAHEVAEWALKNGVPPDEVPFTTASNGIDVTDEMVEAVQEYVDAVQCDQMIYGGELLVEQKVSLKYIHPDLSGTADAVLIPDADEDAETPLIVYDYKHGAGIWVDVVENSQLMIYGLGALIRAENLKGREFHSIELVIVQPRCASRGGETTRRWRIDRHELMQWAVMVLEVGAKATDLPEPRFSPAEEACRWCPANDHCPALREHVYRQAASVFASEEAEILVETSPDPELEGLAATHVQEMFKESISSLSADALGAEMRRLELLKLYMGLVQKEVNARLHDPATGGVQGYKLVRSYGNRKWIEDDAAVARVLEQHGVAPEDCWTKKVLSPAQAEKTLGRSKKSLVGPLTIRPERGIVVAPEWHAQEAYNPISPSDVFSAE